MHCTHYSITFQFSREKAHHSHGNLRLILSVYSYHVLDISSFFRLGDFILSHGKLSRSLEKRLSDCPTQVEYVFNAPILNAFATKTVILSKRLTITPTTSCIRIGRVCDAQFNNYFYIENVID